MGENEIIIAICGDRLCGKSTLASQLARDSGNQEHNEPTENTYSVTRQVDGEIYHTQIIDTPWRRKSRPALNPSALKSDAFVLVYDITSVPSLSNLINFTDQIAAETEERLERRVVPPVKIVVGNKIDLRKEDGDQRYVSKRTGMNWAVRRGCEFIEGSAMDARDVDRIFNGIIRRIVEERIKHVANESNTRVQYRTANGVVLSGFAQGVTRPLTPLSHDEAQEERPVHSRKRGVRHWICFC